MKFVFRPVALLLLFVLLAAFFLNGCVPASSTDNAVAITSPPTPQATSAPMPTASPVLSPTAQATVEPTPIPECGSDFYDAFFNDSVFIGDSITQGLQNYATQMRKERPALLGDARFAAAKSFNLERACFKHAPSDGALRYKGKAMTIPGIINAMEVNNVYIMLGVNDWAGSHIDDCIDLYRKLLQNIREQAPDVMIYVQSCTPVTKEGERAKLNNENMDSFNASLKQICAEESNVEYVDISSALKGEDNCLIPAYSSDHYVHMSKEGAAAWINALYQYAYESYSSGTWTAPDERSAS